MKIWLMGKHGNKILKYIKGEMDVSEKIKMIEWINKNEDNHKKFNILKAKYVASKLKDYV